MMPRRRSGEHSLSTPSPTRGTGREPWIVQRDESKSIEMAPLSREVARAQRRSAALAATVASIYTMSSSRTSRRGPARSHRLPRTSSTTTAIRATSRFAAIRRAASVRVRLGAGDRRRAAAAPRRVLPRSSCRPMRRRYDRAVDQRYRALLVAESASRCRRSNGRLRPHARSASCWWTELPSTRSSIACAAAVSESSRSEFG